MSWTKPKSAPESLEILGKLSAKCAELGGEISKALNVLVLSGDYTSLLAYDLSYSDNSDLVDLIYARQILAFFTKAEFLELGIDREAAAAKRFVESEVMCRDTNWRLKNSALRPQTVESDIRDALSIAVWKIDSVLGELPELSEFDFTFGPGANTNVKGRCANPRVKLGADFVCSTDLSPTVGAFLSETPHWTAVHAHIESEDSYVVNVAVVPGKVMFVPKNAKTNRTICIEPTLNGFYQKGVGAYIRNRLALRGINLRDQLRNQDLAKKGSTDGSLATIDLSMASDCVSRELVWDLLPLPWANLLSSLRTSEMLLPQSVHEISGPIASNIHDGVLRLEKFSSMGNGFTFELESLIFYGICIGVCRVLGLSQKHVSIYGDDIIVPVGASDLLERTLRHCGFSFNRDKSYTSGPFRESCGADYFKGFDIRPYYQKTLVSESSLFTMHNWFVRSCEYELAELTRSLCHPSYILNGPDNFGDGHLIGTHELRVNREGKRRGWEGGYFDTYTLKTRSFKGLSAGDSVLPVYSVYTRSGAESPTDPDVVRGSNGYAKVSIYTLGRSIFSRKD